jgi:hypothetical protein
MNFHSSQKTQYTYKGDENPSIRAADDRLVMGDHAGHGVCSAGGGHDSRGTGMLPPHGGAVRKFHDAGESLLLQGSGTGEHCSSPGAGCRTASSPHHCCGTTGRLVRSFAGGNRVRPPLISSCSTSRTVSRL